MASLGSLSVNVRVMVNQQDGIAPWRVRWAYRLARLFGIPLEVKVEDAK